MFRKSVNPRYSLGIGRPDKRSFKDFDELVKWMVNVYMPYFYNAKDYEEFIISYSKDILQNRATWVPDNLWDHLNNRLMEEIISSSPNIKNFIFSNSLKLLEKIMYLIFPDISSHFEVQNKACDIVNPRNSDDI